MTHHDDDRHQLIPDTARGPREEHAQTGQPMSDEQPGVIDAAHIGHQRAWSETTFGPGLRLGVIDHIRKELLEVEADPTDLEEWVDVIILGFDGAWRAGHAPQAIIDGIKAKQARNEARAWPDWRTADRDKAIEHVRRLPDVQCLDRAPHPGHDWSSLSHRWRCDGVEAQQ